MIEMSFTVQVPDGPRCEVEPLDRPELSCRLPGHEPYKASWHIILGGHIGEDHEGHSWTWRDTDEPRLLPKAVE